MKTQPWLLESDGTSIAMGDQVVIVAPAPDGASIAVQCANAEFIVNAVNCHEELLAALIEVVAISDRKHDAWDRAHAAIAKARGIA